MDVVYVVGTVLLICDIFGSGLTGSLAVANIGMFSLLGLQVSPQQWTKLW